jgi:DNA-3-methyladenine glycosylase I
MRLVSSSDLYKEYYDREWETPVYDDATLFEFLILETFQAGLSWITILNKREFQESIWQFLTK